MTQARNVHEYIQNQREAIASNPDCGMTRYNLATALIGLREFDEAEKELLEAVRCSPTLAEAYVQLGGLCLQRGDMEGCLAYNKKSVTVRAGFFEGYGNIGFVELQQGNIDEAIYSLEKALRFNPNFIQARVTLANAYLMNGEVDKSIEVNHQALEVDPNFPFAHNNLAICYLEKGERELAEKHCKKAMELGYEVAPEIREEIEKLAKKE